MNKKYCAYRATKDVCYIIFHDNIRQKVVDHVIDNTIAEQGFRVLPFHVLTKKYTTFVYKEDICG